LDNITPSSVCGRHTTDDEDGERTTIVVVVVATALAVNVLCYVAAFLPTIIFLMKTDDTDDE